MKTDRADELARDVWEGRGIGANPGHIIDRIAATIRTAQAEARAEIWEDAASHVNCYNSDPGETGEIARALVRQFREKAAALRQAAAKEST